MYTKKPKNDSELEDEDGLLLKEQRYRSFWKMVLMVLNICMSPFYFGYNIQYLGTFDFEKTIVTIYNITIDKDTAKGLYNALVPLGGGIGALTSFLLLKYFSRRNSFLVINTIAIVFGCLIFVQNQYTFLLSRLMQGVCVGFCSAIAPLVIKEFSPTEIAGTLGTLNQFFVAFGVFFACLLQYILNKVTNGDEMSYWRYMFGFTLATTILQTVLLLTVYTFETPRYLLEKNREQECRQVLRWIYEEEYVDDVLQEKKSDLGMSGDKESLVSADGERRVQKKRNKLRLMVSINLAMLQQFVGINAVVIYGTQIAGAVLESIKNFLPVILNLEQTITPLVAGFLLTKIGRKAIIQIGTLVGILSLLLIGIGFIVGDKAEGLSHLLIIGGLVLFMANFGMSLGPIVWLYIPEILEPQLISVSTMANWASAALIAYLFPVLKNALGGPAYLFLFFAGYCALSFMFNQKFMLETKDKQEKQIYQQYQRVSAS